MKFIVLMLCAVLLVADTSCKKPTAEGVVTAVTSVPNTVQKAGKDSAHWSLQQLDKLSHTVAVGAANALQVGADQAVNFLEDEGTQETAEAVNLYLFDVVLGNLNPAVGASIKIAASVLDNVLKVDPNTTLTRAELKILVSFCKGLSDGAQEFLDGKVAVSEPDVLKNVSKAPKFWFAEPNRNVKIKGKVSLQVWDLNNASEHIPPSELLGVTCKDGMQPSYYDYFGWIPTVLLQYR